MAGDFQEMEKRFTGNVAELPSQVGILPHRQTKREQLEQKRKMFEEALRRVNAAIKCLDENPNMEKLLNVLQDAE